MNIFVGNLSYEVTEEDLRKEFEAFGQVSSVAIMKDKYSGQSMGFGFVEMPVLSEGQAAMNALNGKQVKNRAITVNGARERDARGGGGGGRGGGYGGGRGGGGYGRKGGGGGRGGGGGSGGGMRRY